MRTREAGGRFGKLLRIANLVRWRNLDVVVVVCLFPSHQALQTLVGILGYLLLNIVKYPLES